MRSSGTDDKKGAAAPFPFVIRFAGDRYRADAFFLPTTTARAAADRAIIPIQRKMFTSPVLGDEDAAANR